MNNTPNRKQFRRQQAKLARLEIVAKLLYRGYTYRQIKDEVMRRLGLQALSLRTIKEDIDTLKAEYAEKRMDDIEEGRSIALMTNDALIREAWDNYERSRNESGEQTTKLKVVGKDGKPSKEVVKKEGKSTGDVRCLELISKLHTERNKLLGLYAPERKELSGDISFASLLVDSGIEEQ